MVSIEKQLAKLREKKHNAARLRKRAEKQLAQVRTANRRSAASLDGVDKKIQSERKSASEISVVLNQKNSQLESINRLVSATKKRLEEASYSIEQAEQEIEFADSPQEIQDAKSALRLMQAHAAELKAEIKGRLRTAKKISAQVGPLSDEKSGILSKIQRQTKSKPLIKKTAAANQKALLKCAKAVERHAKTEESAQGEIDRVSRLARLAKKGSRSKKIVKKKPGKGLKAKKTRR